MKKKFIKILTATTITFSLIGSSGCAKEVSSIANSDAIDSVKPDPIVETVVSYVYDNSDWGTNELCEYERLSEQPFDFDFTNTENFEYQYRAIDENEEASVIGYFNKNTIDSKYDVFLRQIGYRIFGKQDDNELNSTNYIVMNSLTANMEGFYSGYVEPDINPLSIPATHVEEGGQPMLNMYPFIAATETVLEPDTGYSYKINVTEHDWVKFIWYNFAEEARPAYECPIIQFEIYAPAWYENICFDYFHGDDTCTYYLGAPSYYITDYDARTTIGYTDGFYNLELRYNETSDADYLCMWAGDKRIFEEPVFDMVSYIKGEIDRPDMEAEVEDTAEAEVTE